MSAKTTTCIQIACDICDELYDVEGEGFTQHFATIADAVKYVADDEWKITDSGYAICPADDDDHDQARAELEPAPPAEQIPGQQQIPAATDA